jgi:transposase-like protein
VCWYCKYGISYRNLAEMMQERGVEIDLSTLFRWVQRCAPQIEKRVRPYQGSRSGSWRVDETYVRVGGKWKYLFRAVDKHGQLIDFMLSDRRGGISSSTIQRITGVPSRGAALIGHQSPFRIIPGLRPIPAG